MQQIISQRHLHIFTFANLLIVSPRFVEQILREKAFLYGFLQDNPYILLLPNLNLILRS